MASRCWPRGGCRPTCCPEDIASVRPDPPPAHAFRRRCFLSSFLSSFPPSTAARLAMNLRHPDLFRQQCHVDGRWIDASDGATLAVANPADDRTLGTVPRLTAADVREAIAAADRALPAWRG